MQPRLTIPLSLLLAILLLPARVHPSPRGKDFLIIEKPGSLLIYNSYQQTVGLREKGMLTPFLPMGIVDEDAVLPDGFTRCMKIEIYGTLYYLLKDREKRLVGFGNAGMVRIFRETTVFQDTVEIAGEGPAFLTLPDGNETFRLAKGDLLQRFFSHGSRTYVACLGPHPVFGWLSNETAPRLRTWQTPVSPGVYDSTLATRARGRIEDRLKETNYILTRMYNLLNARTHQQRPAPHWRLKPDESGMVCVLENRGSNSTFPSSTASLALEIERVLLGMPFRVQHTPGQITVSRNNP